MANPWESRRSFFGRLPVGRAEREIVCSVETPMWSTKLLFWVCSIAGLSCGTAVSPNASIIQSAYESEASSGSSLHDRGLKVIEASCDKPVGDQFLCQVTFLSADDPNQRLYFDIVAVSRSERGWELKSGLCKR
jgi:hypothetical protein